MLKMSVSVDGFVGGPNGEIDWIFRSMDEEAKAWTVERIAQAGVHVMGSRTFKDMAAYWPSSTEPFAPAMNEIPKVVFARHGLVGGSESTTQALSDARAQATGNPLQTPAVESWRAARVATGDLAEEIARLKREPGKDILAHGGARFAQSLVKNALIDEYQLLIHPVALGRGLPLFAHLAAPVGLTLIDSRRFGGGSVANIYRPRG
ncbi:MAG TPA: dihydrofolate reductase family protein [Polyangiaceae bacterium]